MRHIDIHIYFISNFLISWFLPRKCTSVVRKVTRDFFCVIKYCTWTLLYNKLCSFYASASLSPITLLVISRLSCSLIYCIDYKSNRRTQLTHNTFLNFVLRNPLAFANTNLPSSLSITGTDKCATTKSFRGHQQLALPPQSALRYSTYIVHCPTP